MTIFYATAAKQVVGYFQSEADAKQAALRHLDRKKLLKTRAAVDAMALITITPHHVYADAAEHEREFLLDLKAKVLARLTEDEKAALAL